MLTDAVWLLSHVVGCLEPSPFHLVTTPRSRVRATRVRRVRRASVIGRRRISPSSRRGARMRAARRTPRTRGTRTHHDVQYDAVVLRPIVVAVTVALLSACAFSDDVPSGATILCAGDSDCPSGTTCDGEHHVCAGPGDDVT